MKSGWSDAQLLKEEMAMADKFTKRIIKDKVPPPRRHMIFEVEKGDPSEQNVLLHFGREVRFHVVKLSTKGLPTKSPEGKKIHWINNWGVTDSKGKFLKQVRYTVFVRKPRNQNARFVYYYHGRLHWDKTPTYEGSKPARDGWRQVDFEIGDPPGGWG
jgi:hypothetical protein